MPVLKTYTATIGPVPATGGRRASAEDFGASAGLGTAGKAIQDFGERVLDQQENDEARKALIISTELRAKYARELDAAALSGGNMAALKEKMAADFAKIGEDFSTKRGVELVGYYAANTELMYDEQANRIEVQRAAANARLQGSKFLNDAAAIIRSNPNYLAVAEANADELVKTFPNLRKEQAAEIADELKKQLNTAAALAQGRVDPEQTIKDLNGGRWNLSPQDRHNATNQAETEIRARRAEAAYLSAEAERQKAERNDKASDQHFKAIIDGTASLRAIMDDPALSPQRREHLIVFMEQRARALTTQEKASSPIAVRDLWLRIHAPETDPTRIYTGDAIFEAVTKGEVNTTDASRLNAMVANQRDENNRTLGSRLSGLMSIVGRALSQDTQFILQPALVAEIQMDYQARVLDKVAESRAAGKNPNDLFTPGHKDYVGAREFIQGSIDAVKGRADAKPENEGPQLSQDLAEARRQYEALPEGAPYRDPSGKPQVKGATRARPVPEPPLLPESRESEPGASAPTELTPRAQTPRGRRPEGAP